MSTWPAGCRIFFALPNPGVPTQFVMEDVLEARDFDLERNELQIVDEAGKLLRLVNFAHVFLITALVTAGPGAPNA